MKQTPLDPAASVIRKFGGHAAVAAIIGKHVTGVYRWTYPRDRDGTNGMVPPDDAQKLLAHARAEGMDFSPSEFFESRASSEAAA